jgi:hypothetical protein
MPETENLVEWVVTCHTEDCGNAGHPITVIVPDDCGAAACGVCGQPITDIVEA